ncbi:phage terminase large subunit family protein [Clostridium sp. USBA 49]|uniref:phage terminase large subunit family protein n=1 Tax=Clostridium sp. USBA 49 TaxID=1881060 RepID=UPI0015D8EE98|nr:terminase family protein [Clostridium sp. USBA 49]
MNYIIADPLFWLSLMGIELEDYQLELFLNFSRYYSNRLIVNKSRQVGLSWLVCLYALIMCHIRGDVTAIFVSYKQSDSADKIKRIKDLYKLIPEAFRQKIVVDNRTSLQFENGSEIISQGKNHVRGSDSNRFLIMLLDEFAFYGSYDEPIYTSLNGLWTRAKAGSGMFLISTPFTEKGRFWQVWRDRKQYRNFRRYKICWWNFSGLVKEGLMEEARRIAPILSTEQRVKKYGNEKLLDIFKGMSLQSFQQEFEAMFSSSIGCYFGNDIEKYFENDYEYCETFEEIAEKYGDYPVYAGYDVASAEGTDRSALFVLVDYNGVLIPVYKKELKARFKEQKRFLEEFLRTVNPEKLIIEENGVGNNLAEDLEEEFAGVVERHTTTQKSKAEDFATIKTMLQKEQFKLVEDQDIILQMSSVRLKQAKNGKAQIVIERSGDGHGDAVMAMSLAVRAYKKAQEGSSFCVGFARY